MASIMQDKHLGKPCHHCARGKYVMPYTGQEWHLECNYCEAIYFVYEPMPHQLAFHKDKHKFRMLAGGYGSSKTTTGSAETVKHILNTPGGTTLIGASTLPQLEQTAQAEFLKMFPESLIEHWHRQKNYIDTVTGHRIIFRPLDDPGKARSLNLSFWWVEEASEVEYEYFVQLQTRLRNHATKNHQGIITTNPDLGWVRGEFLMYSNVIIGATEEYPRTPTDINPTYSTHIVPTEANTYLPPTYAEDIARNRPEWWVNRYLKGSFSHSEGMVYPMVNSHIIEPFEIPKHWKRIVGADYGLSDPTVFLMGAIDPKTGITYIYDEHYEAERDVSYHAEKLHLMLDVVPTGRLEFMVGDPSGDTRSKNDMRSLFDHYAEYDLYFDPATNKILDGIAKVYTFFSLGKLKIFRTCENTVRELRDYKYPERKLGETLRGSDKPKPGNDHSADALKYMIAELPDNPDELINHSLAWRGDDITQSPNNYGLPHALQDDNDIYGGDWYNSY